MGRWLEIMAPYDFAIKYRPGKKQPHCDALSRCEQPRDCQCSEVDTSEALKCGPCGKCQRRAEQMAHSKVVGMKTGESVRVVKADRRPSTSKGTRNEETPWLKMFSCKKMSEKHREDPDIAPIVRALESETKPLGSDMERESPATRQYWVLWDSFFYQR
jgi:hypothetical protein